MSLVRVRAMLGRRSVALILVLFWFLVPRVLAATDDAQLKSVKLKPTFLIGGSSSTTNKVVLTAAAPAGGALVSLSSSDPAIASVPSQVRVAAGKVSKNFTIQTTATNCPTNVSISATLGVTKTATLTVTVSLTGELSESNAACWGSFASDGATTSVADATDFSLVRVGNAATKLTTESGFDTGVRYPDTTDAHWDLTGVNYLMFWTRGDNPNAFGFQDPQPIITLVCANGSFTYTPPTILTLNNVWSVIHVPLAGDSEWTRTVTGSPTLADVLRLEIHQDTWDTGFVAYYDGVQFVNLNPGGLPPPGPPPPVGVNPDAVPAKVLLFSYDPIMENKGGVRMHEAYGWGDPVLLTGEIVQDLRTSSHELAKFQLVQTRIVDTYPFFKDGFQYTDETYDQDVARGIFHDQISQFDYARFVQDFGIVPLLENGTIDEVWLYSSPGMGMWESTMAGNGGYFCNSPPVEGVDTDRMFVIMGWNFERGVGEAIHSFGHRAESVMVHSYVNWLPDQSNNWSKFALLDINVPGLGGVGNVHFPVNGVQDYDYDNPRYVLSNADDWYNYPNFTGITRSINSSEWTPDHVDPQRQYLNWWYDHMPHVASKGPDQFLNNWWRYIVDVNQFKYVTGNFYVSYGVPSVWIRSPGPGVVSGIVPVSVDGVVDGALGRIDLYVDGTYLASDYLAPYTFRWNTQGLTGSHTIVAKGYEIQNGTEGVSSAVTVTVGASP